MYSPKIINPSISASATFKHTFQLRQGECPAFRARRLRFQNLDLIGGIDRQQTVSLGLTERYANNFQVPNWRSPCYERPQSDPENLRCHLFLNGSGRHRPLPKVLDELPGCPCIARITGRRKLVLLGGCPSDQIIFDGGRDEASARGDRIDVRENLSSLYLGRYVSSSFLKLLGNFHRLGPTRSFCAPFVRRPLGRLKQANQYLDSGCFQTLAIFQEHS